MSFKNLWLFIRQNPIKILFPFIAFLVILWSITIIIPKDYLEHTKIFLGIFTTLSALLAGVVAIFQLKINYQLNSAKFVTDLHRDFESREMLECRRQLALIILRQEQTITFADDRPLQFFETLGILTNKNSFDYSEIWNDFSYEIVYYFLAMTALDTPHTNTSWNEGVITANNYYIKYFKRHYLCEMKNTVKPPSTLYENFERLYRRIEEDTASAEQIKNIKSGGEECIVRFLVSEIRRADLMCGPLNKREIIQIS